MNKLLNELMRKVQEALQCIGETLLNCSLLLLVYLPSGTLPAALALLFYLKPGFLYLVPYHNSHDFQMQALFALTVKATMPIMVLKIIK